MDPPDVQLQRIKKMVYRVAPKWIDRESLVQDVWIQCWQAGKEPSVLIVKHRLIDAIRRETRRRHFPLSPDIEDRPRPNGQAHTEVDHLMRLARLSPSERRTVYLHYYQGLSLTDVASEMMEVPSRVALNHQRAMSKLRGALQQ